MNWQDGLPLAAIREDKSNIVGLNFFLHPTELPQEVGIQSQMGGLMANALEWAAQGGHRTGSQEILSWTVKTGDQTNKSFPSMPPV